MHLGVLEDHRDVVPLGNVDGGHQHLERRGVDGRDAAIVLFAEIECFLETDEHLLSCSDCLVEGGLAPKAVGRVWTRQGTTAILIPSPEAENSMASAACGRGKV